jgi:hypothetical protein
MEAVNDPGIGRSHSGLKLQPFFCFGLKLQPSVCSSQMSCSYEDHDPSIAES